MSTAIAKTLALFLGKPGDKVTLKTKPDANITTYVVFVIQRMPDNSKVPVTTFFSDMLESADGASFELAAGAKGYNLVLQADVTADAKLQAEVDFNGASAFNKPVDLPESLGPVLTYRWAIVM